ncbi:winged helix-turn-helix transcriptional regulator [Luteolibacter luteus]|jgi:DNA-binding HxlR family transcriptional regulator|uniref:Helix-turn-helix transcriptional regulator n=1 Tax=Luteolibacter luteus TaxID=2728835 RepID=A0A858RHP0_9BACT|nr:helix-turn-helix domain-containing protein [Luteolibacter luteus]QJE96028.1 helix-turn-helix transcriptional regulator [Luteolibacter luteus]
MSPEHTQHTGETCPASKREILSRIGDKWSLEIVGNLWHGPKRFNELMRSIGGISQRMLTLTLRGLERDGLISRTILPTRPPRVDYELTEMGKTLIDPVHALVTWAINNEARIHACRAKFDAAENS